MAKIQSGSGTQFQAALNAGHLGVMYFTDKINLGALLIPAGPADSNLFVEKWRTLNEQLQDQIILQGGLSATQVIERLGQNKIYLVAQRPIPVGTEGQALYLSCKMCWENWPLILIELKLFQNGQRQLSVKCEREGMGDPVKEMIDRILQ
eukprot:TRINITY_DN98321_c0_g1_i4.p2 TRINITY_DN98321_c0_g1~~TRINITY_DN98321_c0_g1_i4.p2  ORF type:complete len:150 (+),score=22.35 TRINITY_DN98321_c0_g1_i4:104-553(+)